MASSKSTTSALSTGSSDGRRAGLVSLASELNESLAAAQSLLQQLLENAGQKLSALRAADTDELQHCSLRDANMLEQMFHVEQQRTAILARLAQRLPAMDVKRVRLSEMVDRFPEPLSSALRARNAALQRLATELHEKNKLVATVAHHLQSHIRAVFAELAQANQESAVYGREGQHEQRNKRFWLDAVG